MNQEPKLPLKFPKSFFWGAGSSAHQIEGGNHNQWTVWELENAQVLASQAKYQNGWLPKWPAIEAQATDPANYVSGRATDHYNRYEEDFALLKKLNMNAWRFGIEWSRIEPEEGVWNAEAIEHYRKYLKKLKALNIEPIVTLWHWTHPVWFDNLGAWEKRSNLQYFERYAAKIIEELGGDFRYIISINEPDTYMSQSYLEGRWPPQHRSKVDALKVLLNLLAGHNCVYDLAHKTSRKYKVGIAKFAAYHYAGDDAKLTKLTTEVSKWASEDFIVDRIKNHMDFLGINYYRAWRYYGYRMHETEEPLNDMGWAMHPEKIEPVIKDFYDHYNVPIFITENGVADMADEHRKWWISQTLMAMHRLLQSGVKIEGYLHWSLTDNFEWSSGFWPRFGLAEVDYKDYSRKLRPSAVWFGEVIKKIRS